MATATLTGIDVHLRDAVVRQLEWDPEFDASGVGVAAHEGAVTLSGFIDTYAGKLAAERSAKRVRGVRAVANELQVRLTVDRADDEIALDAARALALHGTLPDTIQAAVRRGHVTLTGTVPWLFHKTSAEVSVRHIRGVVAVTNRIVVTPLASFRDVRKRITEALHRVADVNARHVHVDINGTTVTLTGTVSTWGQRDIAERAAAAAPGITSVENLIDVAPADL
jgi:osmotically-inducible protein OsmY